VQLWKKCLGNDPESSCRLYRAYIRSARFEISETTESWDSSHSTHLRFEVQDSSGKVVLMCGRVHFFSTYDDSRGTGELLLTYVELFEVEREALAPGKALYV
jgi:hypothetical protein